MISRPALLLLLLHAPWIAMAEDNPAPDRWAIGAGAALIASPYAGEGERVRPFPLVFYNGERFFLRGISGGMHLYQTSKLTVDAVVSARLDGFDISDLGSAELAANGAASSLLSDRDDGVDLGARVTYRSTLGSFTLEGSRDVAGTSHGVELSLDYGYSWQLGQTSLTASAGSSWLSSDLTHYYYGILDEEVSRGVAAYAPGSVFVPHVGVTVTHALGESKWQLLGSVDYQFLPDALQASPLIDRDRNGSGRVVLGLSRRF